MSVWLTSSLEDALKRAPLGRATFECIGREFPQRE